MEHRLPIVTRWTLYALGAVEGQRVRRPRDPVAAWLLRRHPKLLPTFAAPSILSMIRARAAIVDRMIEDEVHRVRGLDQRLAVWSFGAGFDARWYRLRPIVQDAILSHAEVEDPEVLSFKNQALADSSFAGLWDTVHRVPVREDRWTVHDATDDPTLVILEGVASRLGVEGLRRLLGRIRQDVPHATVIADLPGVLQNATGTPAVAVGSSRTRWSSPAGTGASSMHVKDLRRLGWRLREDHWLSARPELRAPSGMAICAGMEALRVMHLCPD
ncbi:MAG: class I SAM-dependent methyltransferase [Alphaproteobacteria bacterium]|nr:class I SAM-dependent methyltransferase [Alphaproteobacteria bacterium]